MPDLSEEGADLADVRSIGAQDEADGAASRMLSVLVPRYQPVLHTGENAQA